ncbi:hypothetical protein DVH05_003588 [Phytophthora capsici]|nr:hypothetical protein DVH05_003588 [Phytophthora capsici]
MAKGLPGAEFDPSTLGEETIEMTCITFGEGYEEDDAVSSCSDDDDDNMDSSHEDGVDSEEEKTS